MGAAQNFSAFTAIGAFENNGTTSIVGDIGTNVGAFSGFPPGVVIGDNVVDDETSAQAAVDVVIAYSHLAGLTCSDVIGVTLGNGQVLTPGIYCVGSCHTKWKFNFGCGG
ncbi:MAG: DUF3494 domain-containing protein [Saprospiraceae bacterium]|nr:DUF3494 domain-containing protein [Saprospiraceae bacterium]